ncbi:MAG: hypothetical protein M3R18_00205 [Pseudomonadota bacterium]|nr:hypothetical protein [Pseudomonadota bacterium]
MPTTVTNNLPGSSESKRSTGRRMNRRVKPSQLDFAGLPELQREDVAYNSSTLPRANAPVLWFRPRQLRRGSYQIEFGTCDRAYITAPIPKMMAATFVVNGIEPSMAGLCAPGLIRLYAGKFKSVSSCR